MKRPYRVTWNDGRRRWRRYDSLDDVLNVVKSVVPLYDVVVRNVVTEAMVIFDEPDADVTMEMLEPVEHLF